MRRLAYVLINLSHLNGNFAIVREVAPCAKIMAVVKADAYGHGMLEVCRRLTAADAFAVACVDEALELRDSGVAKPILVLQGFNGAAELRCAMRRKIQVVIHQWEQLELLRGVAFTHAMEVCIKLDTGMHRLGFEAARFRQVAAQLESILPPKSNISVMTHLACAEQVDSPATSRQLHHFDQALVDYYGSQSIANSAGILAWPSSHRDWVRPGLMLYGVSPFTGATNAASAELRPVMSFRAPLIAIKTCLQGDTIGYGGEYRCPRDMTIGVVAAGYADGYPRHLREPPRLSIRGQPVTLVGRVSMDMLTVNLSAAQARIGDEVELWGSEINVAQTAECAQTISYELLCAAGNVVHRRYIE